MISGLTNLLKRLLGLLSGSDSAPTEQTQEYDFTYTADGSMNDDPRRVLNLQYDARGRLTQVTGPDATATYEYNALGQRVIKTVTPHNPTSDNPVTTLHLHYSPEGQLLAETDAEGQPLREYLYLYGQVVAMVVTEAGTPSTLYYLHNDHLGTTQLITDASQAVAWEANYRPFGEAEITTEQIAFPLRFPGQYEDGESGLYYNYYRDYDPSLGRYIQSDPIGLLGGLNTYGYAFQNPIRYTDPNGLTPATAAEGAVIGGAFLGPPGAVVGGVIGFGLGTWAASEFWDWYDNKDNPPDDSQQSKKDRCIERCSDSALPTNDNGFSIWNCVNRCMEEPDDCE